MTRDVQGQFQPAPHAELVECSARIVLHDLLSGADDFGDIPISPGLPKPGWPLEFLLRLADHGGA